MDQKTSNWFEELFINEAKAVLGSRTRGGSDLIDAEEEYY